MRTTSRSGAAGHLGGPPPPDPQGPAHRSGLVVETGEALEVHHFATLAGYGAEAINPYLAFDTIQALMPWLEATRASTRPTALRQGGRQGPVQGDVQDGHLDLPVLLRRTDLRRRRPGDPFVDQYFTGTSTTIEGIGLDEVAAEAVRWHRDAFGSAQIYRKHLDVGGDYASASAWREAMSGRPRPSPTCSTRCAATMPRPTPSTPARSTSRTSAC
jgi:hypothetical protein